ncbi:MAG: NADH-quinone oxidoreductase subunit D, partial [Actinobacteria bacterium]|nr:NADH-quinone oxidoreductase subunit D [Actinomycetota bacterium]
LGHTDELVAHGRGRELRWTGALVGLGAIGLAALPPLALLAPNAFHAGGYRWLPPLLMLTSAVTGAAVLRSAGRIFLGLGRAEDPALVSSPAGEEQDEGRRPVPRRGALLWAPGAGLLVAGFALGLWPGLVSRASEHAARFVDRPAVARATLHGVAEPSVPGIHLGAGSFGYAALGALVALALAWLALRAPSRSKGGPVLIRLKLLHDGVVGEYVTWLTVGAATLTGLLALLIR